MTTPEIRMQLQVARTTAYNDIMRTTMFTFAVIAAVIHFGDGSYSTPLMAMTIAVTPYGIWGGTALDDVGNLRDDMDEVTANTTYGKHARARNIGALKMTSSVPLGLVGLLRDLRAGGVEPRIGTDGGATPLSVRTDRYRDLRQSRPRQSRRLRR